MSDSDESGSSAGLCLPNRIDAHLKKLAPHIDSTSAKLLIEARDEISRLTNAMRISWCALSELSPCAHEECQQIQTETLTIALRKAEEVLGHNAELTGRAEGEGPR